MGFSFDQMKRESGGRQFGPDGKPLLGRYRDGSAPPPEKRAYGVAQMQVGTARDTAKRFNIPWDEKKFLTDRAYNLTLGNRHMEYLEGRYGDKRIAEAAYHSGEGNVDRAIARHGRANFARGLGPEGRAYIGMTIPGTGGVKRSKGETPATAAPYRKPVIDRSQVSDTEDFLSNIENAAGIPRNSRMPIANPFEMGDEIAGAADVVTGRLNKQEEFLAGMETSLQAVQDARRQRIEQHVEAKTQINSVIGAETQGMIDRVRPILARRAQLAGQLEKVANMNPLERSIKGIFDLDYNTDFLEGQVQRLDTVLSVVGKDYEYLEGLRERSMRVLDVDSETRGQLETLTLAELDEDGKLIANSIGSASQKFQFLGEQVQASENLIRAQMAQTDRLLTELSPGDIEVLLEKARTSKTGSVEYQGVEVNFGELRQRSMAVRAQEMSFRSQQIALERGETELADFHAERWLESASETQIRAAIDAGGNYKGMHLPIPLLTSHLAQRDQLAGMKAADVLRGNPVMELSRDLAGFAPELNMVASRVKGMFGGSTPPELNTAAQHLHREIASISAQIREAKAKGVAPEVAEQLRGKAHALRENFFKQVDLVADRASGGDQSAAGWMKTYLKGGRLDSNQGAEAMLFYVNKGGLPQGMRSSAQARAAFGAAQQARARVDQEINSKQLKVDQKQRKAMYLRAIQESAQSAQTTISFNEMISALPEVAAKLNDPFKGVSQQDFEAARRGSEAQSYAEVGDKLGITPNDAKLLFGGRYRGANAAELTQRIQREGIKGQTIARQQALFLEYLDRSPSANQNFKPSVALAEMLRRPEVLKFARSYEQNLGGASFGDFLTSSTTQEGVLVDRMGQWGNTIQQQVADNRGAEIAGNSRAYQLAYKRYPIVRGPVLLAAIPGIEPQEEAALLRALKIGRNMPGGPNDAEGLTRAIKGTKFQDPNLERIRQIAAKHWDEVSAMTDRALERFSEN